MRSPRLTRARRRAVLLAATRDGRFIARSDEFHDAVTWAAEIQATGAARPHSGPSSGG